MSDPTPSYLKYIPWTWTMKAAEDSTVACPSPSRILGTYAVTTSIISIVSLVVGHRLVVQKLSCGTLGDYGSRAWRWSWIFSFGLQLGAAGINMAIIRADASRTTDYPPNSLFLLLLTLPRMSFAVLIVAYWIQFDTRSGRIEGSLVGQLHHGSAAATALFAEMFTQLPLLYFFGRVVQFASSHGYYPGGSAYSHVPTEAKMMHGAALFHFLGAIATLVTFLCFAPGMYMPYPRELMRRTGDYRRVSWWATPALYEAGRLKLLCLILGLSSFCADWIFWAGFSKLAGKTQDY